MIEIKSYIGTVLHRSEKETIKAALEEAVSGGADLGGADLRGAYLGGADLRGADLGGADGKPAKITDSGTMLTGYALSYCWWAAPTDQGLLLNYGCETHTVETWRERAGALAVKHGEGRAAEYERLTLALVGFVEAALPTAVPKADECERTA